MPIILDGTLGITTPALTVTGATVNTGGISTAGNLTFTSTGNRITGDFTNATTSSRVLFQTSTANSASYTGVIPSGTGTAAGYVAINSSDPNNGSYVGLSVTSGLVGIGSDKVGTGAYLPMTFQTGGSERMRIDTSGNVGIGTSSPAQKLDVNGSIKSTGFFIGTTGTTGFAVLGTTDSVTAGGSFVGRSATATYNQAGIEIYTGGAERMRITSAGYVGIGTITPSQALQVNGGLIVTSGYASTANGGSLILTYNTGLATGSLYALDPGVLWKNLELGGNQISLTTVGTERVRITSAGNLQFTTANTGIVFNNSSAYVNSTLNDYEEGTFVPTALQTSTQPTITYGSRTGMYTKVGRQVTVQFRIDISSTSGGSGQGFIALPFTVSATADGGMVPMQAGNGIGSNLYLMAYASPGSANLYLYVNSPNGPYAGLGSYTNGFSIICTISYSATF